MKESINCWEWFQFAISTPIFTLWWGREGRICSLCTLERRAAECAFWLDYSLPVTKRSILHQHSIGGGGIESNRTLLRGTGLLLAQLRWWL